MADLQKVLQQNGTFKAELMQAFLQAAQVSFREHQRNPSNGQQPPQQQQQRPQQQGPPHQMTTQMSTGEVNGNVNGHDSGYSSFSSPVSSKSQSPITNDNLGEKFNGNQPMAVSTGDMMLEEIDNLTMNIKSEPGSNFSNCSSLESSTDLLAQMDLKVLNQMNEKMFMDPSTLLFESSFSPPEATCKLEPDSPSVTDVMSMGRMNPDSNISDQNSCTGSSSSAKKEMCLEEEIVETDATKLLEEVRQGPTDVRRALIEQVTESVVEAHFQTCNPTYQNVAEANDRFAEKMASGDLVSTLWWCCFLWPCIVILYMFSLVPKTSYASHSMMMFWNISYFPRMVFVQFLIEKNSFQDIETATASKKEKLEKIVF